MKPNHYKTSIRVAAIQYLQKKIASVGEFADKTRYFVEVAADYQSDFVLFPELFTLQLLSLESSMLSAQESIDKLTEYTPFIVKHFQDLAIKYKINIIAGSHPTRIDAGSTHNITYVLLRDGSVHEQPKIHATPSERRCWGISGANTLKAINTDCGPIGILICYDSEFPELSRHLVDQGVGLFFVPFCTDERQGYLRVRYCSQARAVENQCYMVLSGNAGNLENVYNMDIQYAQSCVLSPCDYPFARDGIVSEAVPNTEAVLISDLNMDALAQARKQGTVLNLKDRRQDLYEISWKK